MSQKLTIPWCIQIQIRRITTKLLDHSSILFSLFITTKMGFSLYKQQYILWSVSCFLLFLWNSLKLYSQHITERFVWWLLYRSIYLNYMEYFIWIIWCVTRRYQLAPCFCSFMNWILFWFKIQEIPTSSYVSWTICWSVNLFLVCCCSKKQVLRCLLFVKTYSWKRPALYPKMATIVSANNNPLEINWGCYLWKVQPYCNLLNLHINRIQKQNISQP